MLEPTPSTLLVGAVLAGVAALLGFLTGRASRAPIGDPDARADVPVRPR